MRHIPNRFETPGFIMKVEGKNIGEPHGFWIPSDVYGYSFGNYDLLDMVDAELTTSSWLRSGSPVGKSSS